MLEKYKMLLEYVQCSAVTRNDSEKVINKLLGICARGQLAMMSSLLSLQLQAAFKPTFARSPDCLVFGIVVPSGQLHYTLQ